MCVHQLPEPPLVLLQGKTITVTNTAASKRDRLSQSQEIGCVWCSQHCLLHLPTKTQDDSVQNLSLVHLVLHSIQPPHTEQFHHLLGCFQQPPIAQVHFVWSCSPKPAFLATVGAAAPLHTQMCRAEQQDIFQEQPALQETMFPAPRGGLKTSFQSCKLKWWFKPRRMAQEPLGQIWLPEMLASHQAKQSEGIAVATLCLGLHATGPRPSPLGPHDQWRGVFG